jgi:CBS domain-containing protein
MLHNGTVWRWNRACYGVVGGRAHLRIENRALPAGPTVLDEVANAALFYGLMVALDAEYGDVAERLSFHDARVNFLAAAQHALRARVTWLDGRRIGVRELLLEELIPAARSGLERVGVPDEDRNRYLDVIEERVASGRTGARWLLDSLARVPRRERAGACAAAVHFMAVKQRAGEPVHGWELLATPDTPEGAEAGHTLAEIMTRDLFTVRPDDVIDLATKVMEWRHIRHVPVEDGNGRLVGLLSTRELLRMQAALRVAGNQPLAVKHFMDEAPSTAPPDISIVEGMQRMLGHESGCLLIVDHTRLLGIVTERDLVRAAAHALGESPDDG